MKFAILFRGIHYKHAYDHDTNFQNSTKSVYQYIINPLLAIGHTIDIYCATYTSEKLLSLINTYNPVRTIVLEYNNNLNNWESQLKFHIMLSNMILENESIGRDNYDIIINMRYDIEFTKSIIEHNIDYSKFNITMKHLSGNCDDNYFVFHSKYINMFKNACITMLNTKKITHEINKYIDPTAINYMYEIFKDDEINRTLYKYFSVNKLKHGSFIPDNIKTSKDHLDFFIDKIQKNHNFGLIRPADGEFNILCNNTLTNCDNWTFNSDDRIRMDLFNALHTKALNLYIGIPCEDCNKHMKDQYESVFNINKDKRTYANIFCNANWKQFIDFMKNYSKGFYLITSGDKECELPIKERLLIDKYLVNNWNTEYEKETDRVMKFISNKKNELICFSAGPLSKIWIPMAMKLNCDNIYLDVGSTLDIFTKGESNRYYIKETDDLSKLICNFKD